uniref:Uncharacterized protein n=1 Tax=Anguilla anguilla TaxID=7936 RepID=A0A0E9SSE5_ANGAN
MHSFRVLHFNFHECSRSCGYSDWTCLRSASVGSSSAGLSDV